MGISYSYDSVFGLTLVFDDIITFTPMPKHAKTKRVVKTIWSDAKWNATSNKLVHKSNRKR